MSSPVLNNEPEIVLSGEAPVEKKTLKTIFKSILNKVVAQKEWKSAYDKLIAENPTVCDVLIYKALIQANGVEEKAREIIQEDEQNLKRKLRKHNLEAAYAEITSSGVRAPPKMIIKLLKSVRGNVEAAKAHFQEFNGRCPGANLSELETKFPEFEKTFEEILTKGHFVPPKVLIALLNRKNGNTSEIISELESLGKKGIKKLGKCLEKGFHGLKDKFKKHCRRSQSRSPSVEVDDETVKTYIQANLKLQSHGFTSVKKNLHVLSEFNGDADAAIHFLIKTGIQKAKKGHKKFGHCGRRRSGSRSSSGSRSGSRSRSFRGEGRHHGPHGGHGPRGEFPQVPFGGFPGFGNWGAPFGGHFGGPFGGQFGGHFGNPYDGQFNGPFGGNFGGHFQGPRDRPAHHEGPHHGGPHHGPHHGGPHHDGPHHGGPHHGGPHHGPHHGGPHHHRPHHGGDHHHRPHHDGPHHGGPHRHNRPSCSDSYSHSRSVSKSRSNECRRNEERDDSRPRCKRDQGQKTCSKKEQE